MTTGESLPQSRSRRDVVLYGFGALTTGALGGRLQTLAPSPNDGGLPNAGESSPGAVFVSDAYRQITDLDDSAQIERALADARERNIKHVILCNASYTISRPIDLAGFDGLTLRGNGVHSTKVHAADGVFIHTAITATGPVSNITIEHLSVVGSAHDDVTEPRRARTFDAGGFTSAFFFRGDRVPQSPYPAIRNVALRSVSVYGTKGLPALFTGVRGNATIADCFFDNCLDVGFTFNESVHFTGNRVTRSADNGVSLSRGNESVVCVGNSFEMCAFWAIWIGGYLATGSGNGFRDPSAPGPVSVTVVGNVGVNMGFGGVSAQGGPKNFVISGNSFSDLKRGPVGHSQKGADQVGIGIYVTGHPVAQPEAVTHYAEGFVIANNMISDAQLGGIVLRGAKNGMVSGNLILRAGSFHRADGKTVVTVDEIDQNYGIAADALYSESLSNITIQQNVIIDDRKSPITNRAVWVGAASNATVANNVATGMRTALSETPSTLITKSESQRPNPQQVPAGTQLFDLTLGKPIWSNGKMWVDASGAAL
ncbi:hypothetical protein ACLRGF_01600 [Mycetocola zhadangensis]|uniref:hypothetical protein n=1 Tax=Mycetocola zhadangensis TaxID=1164595 RepID=UPI003A4DB2E7